jgi:carbon-monoxide dehydrogenase small subunit
MLIAAQDLLMRDPAPDRATIREHLSGNYCRCTGYHAIVDAIVTTAESRRHDAAASGRTTRQGTPG